MFDLPAYKVDTVDTTGCGDVFHGAFALAVARKESVSEAARFASAAAALCSTKIGYVHKCCKQIPRMSWITCKLQA